MRADQPFDKLLREQGKLVILPIGTCEQHGPYLPIDTDLRIAQLIAENLEHKLIGNECLLLPIIPFSCSWEHKGAGTIALSHTTIANIIHDVAYSLKAWTEPSLFILLNWHGGNNLLSSLAAEITAKENVSTIVVNGISEAAMIWSERHPEDEDLEDVHAGAIETSIVKAYWPELVENDIPKSAKYQMNINPSIIHAALQAFNMHHITRDGIWGDPSIAEAGEGVNIIEKVTQSIYEQIQKTMILLEKVNTSGGVL